MKRLVALLVVLVFSCSTENINEQLSFTEKGQPCTKVKNENKFLQLAPALSYSNDIEFFESLEVVSAPNNASNITHISWDHTLTNGNYFRVAVLDSDFNYMLSPINLGTQQYVTSNGACESVVINGAFQNGNTYHLWIQTNTNTGETLNVYVPISL